MPGFVSDECLDKDVFSQWAAALEDIGNKKAGKAILRRGYTSSGGIKRPCVLENLAVAIDQVVHRHRHDPPQLGS